MAKDKEIFLARHGKNEKSYPNKLTKEGVRFSKKLLEELGNKSIEFVIYQNVKGDRCKDTIFPLITAGKKILDEPWEKKDFKPEKLERILERYSKILICFRYESLENILDFLKINDNSKLHVADSDWLYGRIFHLIRNGDNWILVEVI